MKSTNRLRVLTWHVHGSYLYYLTQVNCDFIIPYKADASEGYGKVGDNFAWGSNLHMVPAEEIQHTDFDIILFQSRKNYEVDQYEILTDTQRELPKIFLEHDPPRETPTDTRHIVDDPNILLVHVTAFNKLMWDSGKTPSMVIDHGVTVPESVKYTGELDKGIVVINNLALRGRRLGLDVFEEVRKEIPLDLVGMGSLELGGLGEIPHNELPEFISQYRFVFNPIRYTSLGLTICESMMLGSPVVALATTEMTTVIENGVTGFVHTDTDYLIGKMNELIKNKTVALQMSEKARTYATLRFNIVRFAKDWENVFKIVTNQKIEAEASIINSNMTIGGSL